MTLGVFAGPRIASQHAFEFVERFGQRRYRLRRFGMGHAIGPLTLGLHPRDKLRRLAVRHLALDVHTHPDQWRVAVPKEFLRFLRGAALQVVTGGKTFGGEENLGREDR